MSLPSRTRAESVRLLAATAAAVTSCVLPAFLIGSQAVQLQRDLDLTDVQIGLGIALAWIGAAGASALMGRLSERTGGPAGLRIAALVSAAAMTLIAAGADGLGILALGAAIAGGANALAQPSANLLIARQLPAHRHGLAFGIKQSAIPFATLLGGAAVPTITLTLGWRWTFAAGALLAVTAALLVPQGGAGGVRLRREGAPRQRLDTRRRVALAVLGLGIGLGAAAAGGLAAFVVLGAVDAGIAEGPAGLLLAGGSVAGITVRMTMGARADRVGGDQLQVVARMMAIGSLAVAALALASAGAYLLATPFAFGAGWAWPGLFNLSVVRRYPEAPGAATGVTQTGTYLGAGLGPLAFGAILEASSIGVAWLVAAAWLLLASVAVTLGRRLAH